MVYSGVRCHDFPGVLIGKINTTLIYIPFVTRPFSRHYKDKQNAHFNHKHLLFLYCKGKAHIIYAYSKPDIEAGMD